MASIEKCLIVGGGIAGLTAAIALGRRGVRCTVVERRNEPAGAGITIQYRALDALNELGLFDTMAEFGSIRPESESFRYLNANGEVVSTLQRPATTEGDLPSAVTVHRVPFAEMLRTAAKESGALILDGTTVTALTQDEERAIVTLSSGDVHNVDLVIAADGVHSATRELVFGAEVFPIYTGTTMFRWVAHGVPDVGMDGFYFADHLVVLDRLSDGSIYLATGRDFDEPQRFSRQDARRVVRENLAEFDAPLVRAVLEQLDDSAQMIVNDYFSFLLPDPWFRGRVVVIGDAAHATSADLSAGGGMAIEDAVVLADELFAGRDLQESLRRFMTRRFDRCSFIVNTSVEIGDLLRRGASGDEQNALRARGFSTLREQY